MTEYTYYPGHPVWEEPAPNTVVWRYMTLGKFLSLLQNRALYFRRLDRLTDAFEGTLTKAQKATHERRQAELPFAGLSGSSPALVESTRANTIVNCWCTHPTEDELMWNTFVGAGREGVAISSTAGDLARTFTHAVTGHSYDNGWTSVLPVRIAQVKYVDFSVYDGDVSELPILKRNVYSGERELRVIASDHDPFANSTPSFMGDPHPSRFPQGGDLVPAKLRHLITSVHVRPPWLREEVAAMLELHGIGCPVHSSELDAEPATW